MIRDYLRVNFARPDQGIFVEEPGIYYIRNFDRRGLAAMFCDLGFTLGAEIGVLKGEYSEVLCYANPKLHLYCIDPWLGNKAGFRDTALKHLADCNCTIIQNTSMEAVGNFADNSLDFVFLDGNHTFPFIVNDLIQWTPKVRVGGIVAGHDYLDLAHSGICHVAPAIKNTTRARTSSYA
jgi:hypothetical protein